MDPSKFFMKIFTQPTNQPREKEDKLDLNEPSQIQRILEDEIDQKLRIFRGSPTNPGIVRTWEEPSEFPIHQPSYFESSDGKVSQENFDKFVTALKEERKKDKIIKEENKVKEFRWPPEFPDSRKTFISVKQIQRPDGVIVTHELRRQYGYGHEVLEYTEKTFTRPLGDGKFLRKRTLIWRDGTERYAESVVDADWEWEDIRRKFMKDETLEVLRLLILPNRTHVDPLLWDDNHRTRKLFREFFGRKK